MSDSEFQTTLGQWRKVFGIACAVAVGTYFVYQVFGTSEVQKWNYTEPKDSGSTEQVQPLQTDETKDDDDDEEIKRKESA